MTCTELFSFGPAVTFTTMMIKEEPKGCLSDWMRQERVMSEAKRAHYAGATEQFNYHKRFLVTKYATGCASFSSFLLSNA